MFPITCGEALTCGDLHGLERGRECPVENWTSHSSEVRHAGDRGQQVIMMNGGQWRENQMRLELGL